MANNSREERVIHVFERRRQKMDPKDAFNATPFLIVIVVCIGALILSIVLGFITHRSNLETILFLKQQIRFVERRADTLMDKLENTNTFNSYRDKVTLTIINMRRSDNRFIITGDVHNTGQRRVADIGITLYFLDENDAVIKHETFTSEPSDGMPLIKDKKRSFMFTMPNPKGDVTEIRAVITDITFTPGRL